MAEWLRDGYLELAQSRPLDFEKLRPAEPCSNPVDRNWETDARKWEMTARTWETLARICFLQTEAAALIRMDCPSCGLWGGPDSFPCKCRLSIMVDEVFREELESLKENSEHVEHPLPSCKLCITATPYVSSC